VTVILRYRQIVLRHSFSFKK